MHKIENPVSSEAGFFYFCFSTIPEIMRSCFYHRLVWIFTCFLFFPAFGQKTADDPALKSTDKINSTINQVVGNKSYFTSGKGNITLMADISTKAGQVLAEKVAEIFSEDSSFTGGQLHLVLSGQMILKNKKELNRFLSFLEPFTGKIWLDYKGEIEKVIFTGTGIYALASFNYGANSLAMKANQQIQPDDIKAWMWHPKGEPMWLDAYEEFSTPENAFYTCKFEKENGKEHLMLYTAGDTLHSKTQISGKLPVVKDGAFTWYYPNGTVLATGFYKDNLQTGEYRQLAENGQVIILGEFEEGEEVGNFDYWYENGQKWAVWQFVYGRIWNVLEQYSEKGEKQASGSLYNGTGEHWRYHSNGKMNEIINYQNGVRQGVTQQFDSTGILRKKYTYLNGYLNGFSFEYDSLGQLETKVEWKEGTMDGIHETYNSNGKIFVRAETSAGFFEGPVEYYNASGEFILSGYFTTNRWEIANNLIDKNNRIYETILSGGKDELENFLPLSNMADLHLAMRELEVDTSELTAFRELSLHPEAYVEACSTQVMNGIREFRALTEEIGTPIENMSFQSEQTDYDESQKTFPREYTVRYTLLAGKRKIEVKLTYEYWGWKMLYATNVQAEIIK